MITMRAKMRVTAVEEQRDGNSNVFGEELYFTAVTGKFSDDGDDEDNSYAKWSPSAELTIYVANPALFGKFKKGDTFYLDFTPAP